MNTVLTAVRRSLWLVLFGAAGGAAWAWWRDRDSSSMPAPAEWPPLSPTELPVTAHSVPEPATAPVGTPDTIASSSVYSSATATASTARSSIVNALVDAPEARSGADSGQWVIPLDDGSCPVAYPVKANDNSGIFHVPDGRFYNRTNAERCYISGEAATADGYRQSKN